MFLGLILRSLSLKTDWLMICLGVNRIVAKKANNLNRVCAYEFNYCYGLVNICEVSVKRKIKMLYLQFVSRC